MQEPTVLRFGVFELNLSTPELTKHGVRLKLPPQSVSVLALLVSHGGQVVTRQQLREMLWPDKPYGDHDQGLHKIISHLREVLGDSATSPRFLETVPRVGYRFLATVEAVKPAEVVAPPPPTASLPPAVNRRWKPRALIAVPVAALLVLAAVAFLRSRAPQLPVLAPRRLTVFAGSELYPAFSPDGRQIAFSWDGDSRDKFDIYVMEVASQKVRQLTRDPGRDYCPVWSPDGRSIAFLRALAPARAGVFLVGADGAGERMLTEVTSPREFTDWYSRSLAWTRDPDLLVIRDAGLRGGPYGLSLLSLRTGDRQVITAPPVYSDGDDNPAVSPDGKRLAFTRRTTGLRTELYVVDLSGTPDPASPPRRLTSLDSHIESPAWYPDGRDLLFAAAPPTAWIPRLLRVRVATGEVSEISAARVEGLHPAFQPGAGRLLYARRNIEETSIWRAPIPAPGAVWTPSRLMASTEGGLTYPNPSPDGKRIAFRSLRSGAPEVWIADADGANPRQITHVGGNGAQAPRWSPDGKWIAYESRGLGPSKIWIADPYTGSGRQLTVGPSDDIVPSWSRDGRTIYFASTMSGTYQIWTIPAASGTPVQITRNGGSCAAESPDSRFIYYTAGGYPAVLRKTSLQGHEESDVAGGVPGICCFAVVPEGLFYLSAPSADGGGAGLRFLRFTPGPLPPHVSFTADLHRFLSSSADGRFLYYSQTDRRESDLMIFDKPL